MNPIQSGNTKCTLNTFLEYQEYRSALMNVHLGKPLHELCTQFLTYMIDYPNKMTYDANNNHWYPIYDLKTAKRAEIIVAERILLED